MADGGGSSAGTGAKNHSLPKEEEEVDGFARRPPAGQFGRRRIGASRFSPRLRRDYTSARKFVDSDGDVVDWDAYENAWHHALHECLSIDPSEHPILVSEATWASTKQREKMLELLFEKFDAPAVFVGRTAALAAFGAGRSTALVADCGASGCRTVPILDGYALRKPSRQSPFGGEFLEAMTVRFLEASGTPVHPRYAVGRKHGRDGELKAAITAFPNTHASFREMARLDAVRDIKETLMVCPYYVMEERELAIHLNRAQITGATPRTVELPDGTPVDVGTDLYRIPELLMDTQAVPGLTVNPDVDCPGWKGLHTMLYESLTECDADARKDMVQNIVLTGGSSLFTGIQQRLVNELVLKLPATHKARLITPSSLERRFAAWIGGSVLASLGSFQQMWLSKAEFHEYGSSLAEQRFP